MTTIDKLTPKSSLNKAKSSNKNRIHLSAPHMGGLEQYYVNKAFRENYISTVGRSIDNFEEELRGLINTKNVLATQSGTSSIHLSLLVKGLKQDDLVLVQSFTFAATANPIRYQGAIPIFIDSELDTWNMDPVALEEAIIACLDGSLYEKTNSSHVKNFGPKLPKAIIPVHLYGMPAKMNEILAIGKKYGIPVIEDAAEALGSHIEGIYCGTFGELGIYSFNGNKIITTGGGGALISNDDEIIAKAKFLATQAKDNAPHYQHSFIGYNYRMSNIAASIGLGQLNVLKSRISERRNIYEYYKNNLCTIPGITFLDEPEGYFSNRWLTTILIDSELTNKVNKDILKIHLELKNIESRPLWKPLHMQPIFLDFPYFGSRVSEKLFDQGICLPSSSSLTINKLNFIIQEIKHALD